MRPPNDRDAALTNEGVPPLESLGTPSDAAAGAGGVAGLLSSLHAEFREAQQLLDAARQTLDRGENQVRHALGVALSYTGWRDTASPQVDGLIIGFARIGGCRLTPIEMAVPSPSWPAGDSSLSPNSSPLRDPPPSTLHPPPSVSLLVRLLGPFVLEVNDRPVERWQRGKAKSLCKFLVAHRSQPVTREGLMEHLWPEASPETASGRLKVTVHALRQIVNGGRPAGAAGDCILFEDGFYRVNPRLGVRVDTEEFQRHWEAGRACERRGDVPAAIAEFEQAEVLYRGDYLEEDLYEEWTQVRREYLKDVFLAVLTRLADNCLAEDDYDGCLARCHHILGRDNTREDAYRRLMLCHGRMGHIGQALGWYRLCTEILQRELELEPGPETESLHRLLRAGRPV